MGKQRNRGKRRSMAHPIKNVTVTRRVSEAENPINAGPRLRVGLLFVLADGTIFIGRAIANQPDSPTARGHWGLTQTVQLASRSNTRSTAARASSAVGRWGYCPPSLSRPNAMRSLDGGIIGASTPSGGFRYWPLCNAVMMSNWSKTPFPLQSPERQEAA